MADSSGRFRLAVRIGVEIPDHKRLLRIESVERRREALAVWTVANCRTRGKEESGWCALQWLDPYATVEVVTLLVDVGLLAYEDQDGVHGVRVLRYEEFNETKEEIDYRLRKDRARAKASRRAKKVQPTSTGRPPDVDGTSTGSLGTGTGTGNGSVSSQDLSLGLNGGAGGHGATASPSKRSKGRRIEATWMPSAESLAWCREQGVDGERCVPEFVDHWTGVAGAKGVKLDWDGTFRNRVRALVEQGRAPVTPPPPTPDWKPKPVPDAVSPEVAAANAKEIREKIAALARSKRPEEPASSAELPLLGIGGARGSR